jgi:hypothetical protein
MLLFARGAELTVNGIGQSTASQQLDRSHILGVRREGKYVLYRADKDGAMAALTELRTYLKSVARTAVSGSSRHAPTGCRRQLGSQL